MSRKRVKESSPDWQFVRPGLGGVGEYQLNGWAVYCRGAGWFIRTPSGYTLERCFTRSANAKRAVEEVLAAYDRI